MTLGTLSGFTVGITADRRAEEQAQLLERRGATTIHAPVIRTLPLSEEAELREATEDLMRNPADLLVVSTGLAMRGWISAVEDMGLIDGLLAALRGTHVMVRGPKAVGATHAAGLDVGWAAEEATYDAMVKRLLAQSAVDADGRALRVAVLEDGAGSPPVMTAARRHGFDVVPVPVYRWDRPVDDLPVRRMIVSIGEGGVDAVTFTSAWGAGNFFAIAQEMELCDRVVDAFNTGATAAVAVGPVTASRLRSEGIRFTVEPRTPRLGAMVQALAESFTTRGHAIGLAGHRVRLQGRLVTVDGEPLASLTDRERAVLQALAERNGAVVSKRTLMAQVWGEAGDDHVVEVTVARLRRRLGTAGDAIETVVRRGYRLAADRLPVTDVVPAAPLAPGSAPNATDAAIDAELRS